MNQGTWFPFRESSTKFQVTLPGTSFEGFKDYLGMITLTSFITMPAQMNRIGETTALAWPSLRRYTENKVTQNSKRCIMLDLPHRIWKRRAWLQAFPNLLQPWLEPFKALLWASLGSGWPDLFLDECLHFNLQCKAIRFKERQATAIRSVFLWCQGSKMK